MSYQNTTNLQLKKDNSDEQIVNWRTHNNDNLDILDQLIHYILLSMASIENGTTSSTTYNAGSYMIFNGRLCRATNRIGAGDSLLIGVNIEYAKIGNTFVTLQNALNDINAWQTSDGVFEVDLIPSLSTDKLTSGTLPILRGGTGLTSSPSMLVNLESGSADTVLKASPRPGVTGTLSTTHGGTGQGDIKIYNRSSMYVTAGSGCSISSAEAYRWGYVLEIFLGIVCNSAKSSGDVIATLKEGFRPVTTTPLINAGTPTQGAAAYTNGEVQAKGSVPAGGGFYVTGTYLLTALPPF